MKNITCGSVIDAAAIIVLLGSGIYFTVKSNFYQLTGIRFIVKNTVGTLLRNDKTTSGQSLSPFQAVCTALAGTMGVGNIAGVATALTAGGPGAIFWMWLSAFFGMMTKYSEIYLAVKYRRRDSDGRVFGGPMYYIEHGAKKKWLACIFAFLCVVFAASVGNLTQVNAVSTSMLESFSVPLWLSGAVAVALAGSVIVGGVKRIGSVAELVIPFISIAYICVSIGVLIINRQYIAPAFSLITQSAFSFDTAAGGVLGYGISRAIKIGLSRGVFTNEAGLGSAPIVHAGAECKSAGHQAVWGIFEVFLDTIVVCTLTALVLLTAGGGNLWRGSLDGAPLTQLAFESVYSGFGGRFIALSIVFFALAAILGWYCYGETALRYLFGDSRTALLVYRAFYFLFIFLGSVGEIAPIWDAADIFVAAMSIPNIAALVLLRNEVRLPGAIKRKRG